MHVFIHASSKKAIYDDNLVLQIKVAIFRHTFILPRSLTANEIKNIQQFYMK